MNELILIAVVFLALVGTVVFLSKKLADTNTLLAKHSETAMRHALSINTDSREFMRSGTDQEKEIERLRGQIASMREKTDITDLGRPENGGLPHEPDGQWRG